MAAVLKDDYVIRADRSAVNPENRGTKAALHYVLDVAPGAAITLRFRLRPDGAPSQTGTQDPYEAVGTLNVGERIVIVQFSGVGRFLHLDTGRARLAIATAGKTRGHNASGAARTTLL